MAIQEKFLINLLKNYARAKKNYTYLTVVRVSHLRTAATFESYTLTPLLVKSNPRNESSTSEMSTSLTYNRIGTTIIYLGPSSTIQSE